VPPRSDATGRAPASATSRADDRSEGERFIQLLGDRLVAFRSSSA